MDILITLIRFPIGCITSAIAIIYYVFLFPIEVVYLIVMIPWTAIMGSRNDVHDIADGFPNSLRKIPEVLSDIWDWVGRY